MTSRSRENGAHTSGFSPNDSSTGNISFIPLDIELWNKSVSGSQLTGSDLFSSSADEYLDMSGHFQEAFLSKDDNISTTSSMDDSAYQSQVDSGRRGPPSTGSARPQISQGPALEHFISQDYYSPTLSAGSQGFYPSSQSDMMALPPAAQEYQEESYSASEFTNYSSGQMQGRSSFQFTGQTAPRFFGSQTDFTFNQESWPPNDLQTYSRPFAVPPMDATSLPYRQQQFANDAEAQQVFASMMSRQPRVRKLPSDALSVSSHMTEVQQYPTTQPDFSPRPSSSRHNSSFAQDVSAYDTASLVSPVSTVIDTPRLMKSEQSFPADTFSDMSGAEMIMQRSAAEVKFGEDTQTDSRPNTAPHSTSSEEAEMKIARAHPLYQATPQTDDLYHCPYEGQQGCGHKPTKLKCNYDKYVDSHLKPFRCKVQACMNLVFSSTACLLRHEREAHGMHGHGSKPHLCTYSDCERAIPGNGFPRRYNLLDHMKRVHDYTPTTSSPNHSPTTAPGQPALKRQNSKKRKSPSDSFEQAEKRQKASSAKAQAIANAANLARKAEAIKKLHNEWSDRRALLQHRLQNLQGPQDISSHLQVSDDVAFLHRIAEKITELG